MNNSLSEDYQKYLIEFFKHVLQKKKTLITLFSALPPPILPPFCPLFASLVNILQSDVMLYIIRTILHWAVEHNGYAWSESMLQRVGLKTFIIYMFCSKSQNTFVSTYTQKIQDKCSVSYLNLKYIVTAFVSANKIQA